MAEPLKTVLILTHSSFQRVVICILSGILVINFLGYLNHSGIIRSDERDPYSQTGEEYVHLKRTTVDRATISHSLAGIGITQSPQEESLWKAITTIGVDHSRLNDASTFQPQSTASYLPNLIVLKRWQESILNRSHRLYIFSAWLDRRGLDDSNSVIVRVVVIASAIKDIEKLLFCTYFNELDDENEVSLPARSSVATGPRVDLDEGPMQGYVIACSLPDKTTPSKVSVHFGERDKNVTASSAVRVMAQSDSQVGQVRELTACVTSNSISDKDTTAVDSMDEYRALEWVIMQRILGVEHMTVYLNQINPRHRKIMWMLMTYRDVNPKSLSIHSYDYITKQSTKELHDLHSSSIVSDCFYGYLGTSKRVLVLRLEEFLIPKKRTKLSGFLRRLENGVSVANSITPNFFFRVQYFFPNFLPRFDVTPYSIALRYVLKSNSLKGDPNRKISSFRSVISTSACSVVEFSRCIATGNDSIVGSHQMVPEMAASVHNYESCDDEIFNCTTALSSSTVDESIRKFEKVLMKRLSKNILLFFNHNL